MYQIDQSGKTVLQRTSSGFPDILQCFWSESMSNSGPLRCLETESMPSVGPATNETKEEEEKKAATSFRSSLSSFPPFLPFASPCISQKKTAEGERAEKPKAIRGERGEGRTNERTSERPIHPSLPLPPPSLNGLFKQIRRRRRGCSLPLAFLTHKREPTRGSERCRQRHILPLTNKENLLDFASCC